MTDSDELLVKADALLARWRSGPVVPRPPADYPVLTDVVRTPVARGEMPLPEIKSGPDTPTLDAAADSAAGPEPMETLDMPEVPPLDAPAAPASAEAVFARDEAIGEFAHLTSIEDAPAPAEAADEALEEHVRLRVLEAIEPYVGAFLEEPLRLRIEEMARRLAAGIASEAREEILALVRDAVRSAVERELESQRNERSRGR